MSEQTTRSPAALPDWAKYRQLRYFSKPLPAQQWAPVITGCILGYFSHDDGDFGGKLIWKPAIQQ